MTAKVKPKRRNGVLQLPVVRIEGIVPGSHSRDPLGWHTGIRCPRCQTREVIYNGNYFCSGWADFDSGRASECEWALPCPEPTGTDPHHADLEKALIATQMNRP